MALSGAMEEAMGILVAEETGSLSAPQLKRYRCYANRDRKVTYLRLHHNYFEDDCVYPVILSPIVLRR
jgi:hypothetical protein